MSRRLTIGSFVIACLFALAAAPVPKEAAKPVYFPTVVGAKWVYEHENGIDEAVTVSEVKKDGDDLIVSRKGVDGNQSLYAQMVVSAGGLRQERELADGKVGWVLKTNLRAGDSWAVPDGGTRTVSGPEEIEVPAGKYKALRVVWEYEGGSRTSWYAPGIGEVKRVQKSGDREETVTRRLKSFQPK